MGTLSDHISSNIDTEGSINDKLIAFFASLQYIDSSSTWVREGSAAGDDLLHFQVSGDANPRFIINADGKLEWGSGSGAVDTNLYRLLADNLKTDATLIAADRFSVGANPIASVQATVVAGSASTVGQVIKLAASQTANALEVQNSAGTVLASISEIGRIGTTERIRFGDGAVGSPALAFAADFDTGVYSIAADNIGIAAGGSKILDLHNDGGTLKIGFFGGTAAAQPASGTTAEAAFVENSGGTAVNVDSTFGGYTLQQVVQGLQDLGLFA